MLFAIYLPVNNELYNMCIYTQPTRTTLTYFLPMAKISRICKFVFFLKETMVNHKKMVHPPCIAA